MIEAAGASLLCLPHYSPDFNPIENAFAKLKALLRQAAERTVDGLWSAIGRLHINRMPQLLHRRRIRCKSMRQSRHWVARTQISIMFSHQACFHDPQRRY